MTWLARGLGAVAIVVFGWLILDRGIPRSIELAEWETLTQQVALVIAVLAYVIAWKWDGLGGALMVVGAILLGMLASVEYTPRVALFAALGFFVPGALFLFHWQQHHRPIFLGAVVTLLAVMLAGGAAGSNRVYNYFYGSTHAASSTELPGVDLVEWAWSGAVTPNAFSVNAKLDEDDGTFVLLVSRSEDLSSPLRFDGQVTRASDDPVVVFRAAGLDPDTDYHYAVEVDGVADIGRRGSVRTFPVGVASFTIAFGSCIITGSNGSVFDSIRAENPLLFLIAGDFQYENVAENDPDALRAAYERNLTSPAQQALYLSAPITYAWDDHDYGGDGSDGTSAARPSATSVYRENVPHYDLPDSDGGIYHAFSIGRVRFILTDTRSHRDPATEADDANKSMLGDEQKAWLKAEMLAAKESHGLIAWVNGVPWIAEAAAGGDDWGGYSTEREEIANFIAENGIINLVMLSGDAHMLAIDDGTNSNFATNGKGAGFPVFHAAALDRPGKVKGGPYSEGTYPGGGQYGVMSVTDDGSRITVRWSGRDYTGAELVGLEFTVE